METYKLIEEIQKLPIQKRMFVIEKTMYSLRKQNEENEMKKAVDILYFDYMNDKELTAFTDLDFENFYETK